MQKRSASEYGSAVEGALLTRFRCRENFLAIVQPLLAGLQSYTGLTLNIIGARINEDTQQFETLRYVLSFLCGLVCYR
jgi:hypothetical protein